MKTEKRYSELSLDDGRRLRGVVMKYNTAADVGGGLAELFRPGAFGDVGALDLLLNWQHQRERPLARTGGGGLTLTDSDAALEMVAVLPDTREANDAVEMVKRGIMRGLSVEFHALHETMQGNMRIVERAKLVGVGLVDVPAFPGSTVEARETRARLSTRIRAKIPYGKNLGCGCHKGMCQRVNIARGAFEEALEAEAEILTIKGEFQHALASKKRGSMTLTDTKEALVIETSLPDMALSRDLLAQAESTKIIARPVFNQSLSEFIEDGDVAHYNKMHLRAIVLGATDDDNDWPEIELIEPEAREKKDEVRVWL